MFFLVNSNSFYIFIKLFCRRLFICLWLTSSGAYSKLKLKKLPHFVASPGYIKPTLYIAFSNFKISGAGGGGFMIFYCPATSRYNVIDALQQFGGQVKQYQFVTEGLRTWSTA